MANYERIASNLTQEERDYLTRKMLRVQQWANPRTSELIYRATLLQIAEERCNARTTDDR